MADEAITATTAATDATTVVVSEEMRVGASYGRYRGWKSAGTPVVVPAASATPVAAAPAASSSGDAEELPAQDDTQSGEGAMSVDAAGDASAEPAAPAAPAATLPGAIVVQFEATAREDFRVGFAPPRVGREPSQWAYEVAVGYSGNTEVVWRKHQPRAREKEVELVRVFAGRTCSPTDFVPYWIVVQQGTLVFGIGARVGADTVAKYVDPSFVGVQQVALTTWDSPATFRNVVLTPVYDAPLDVAGMVPGTVVRADPSGREDLVTPAERAEFERACEAARRRAERFGGEYVAPAIKTFVNPKTVRKLQRTGAVEPGFATGFDLTSAAELSKREQRMKRFNTPEFAVAYSTETVRALSDGMTQDEWQEKQREQEKLRERARKFGLAEGAGARELKLAPANGKVRSERVDVRADAGDARTVAVHMYSLDERFQQVRTGDVLAYFEGYGPSYVEWINDSSCTVVFQDPFTAGRALVSLGQEIPPQTQAAVDGAPASGAEDVEMDGSGEAVETTTAADSTTDSTAMAESFNRSLWRFGLPIGSSSQPRDKQWRVLLRKATDDDFPPEKTHKKYHERSQVGRGGARHAQPRGRDRRSAALDGSSMPSRYSSARRESSRAHPYAGDRRRRERADSRDFDDEDGGDDRGGRGRRRRGGAPRDSGKPSDRFRVNDDGSIETVRSGARATTSSPPPAVAPATAD